MHSNKQKLSTIILLQTRLLSSEINTVAIHLRDISPNK